MQQGFVEINGVPTKVITWGKWIEDKFIDGEQKDLIICIPGNPGVTRFYTVFLQTIYEKVGYPIWIIGHAGHELPANNGDSIPKLKGNEHLYGLEGQIEHKAKFIKKYVPEDVRIYFMGHSIGAYMCLQLLKDPSVSKKVVKNCCLFPGIEHIANSDNGKFILTKIAPIAKLLLYITWLFSILPSAVKTGILWVILWANSIPKFHLESYKHFLHPVIMANFFHVGKETFTIFERDNDTIRQHKSKLKFYYAVKDRWCPQSYYEKFMAEHPDIDIEICSHNYEHAFVLKTSESMAAMVSSWILNVQQNTLYFYK